MKKQSKHQQLIEIVSGVIKTQGFRVRTNVDYGAGELDVLCRQIYYEVKSNRTPKGIKTAKDQLERAIKYRKAVYGYMVTSQGVYDVLNNGKKIK